MRFTIIFHKLSKNLVENFLENFNEKIIENYFVIFFENMSVRNEGKWKA